MSPRPEEMKNTSMSLSRWLREEDARERARDRQRETFDVHGSGRSLLSHPKVPTTVGGALTVPPAVTIVNESNVNAGQHVELTATGDSIASGGDYIVFDTIADQFGFDGVTAASDTIALPAIPSQFTVDIEWAWDSYYLAGTVEIEVGGAVVHSFGGPLGLGQFFNGRWSFRGLEGQSLKIKITQNSGSAQTGNATVRVTLHDPTGVDAADGTVPLTGFVGTDVNYISTTSDTASLAVPTNTVAGEYLAYFAHVYQESGAPTCAGFDLRDESGPGPASVSAGCKVYAFTRVATVGDLGTNKDFVSTSSTAIVAALIRIPDSTNWIGADGDVTNTSTSVLNPSVTGATLIAGFCGTTRFTGGNANPSPDTGWTTIVNGAAGHGSGGGFDVAYEDSPADGSHTWTYSASGPSAGNYASALTFAGPSGA